MMRRISAGVQGAVAGCCGIAETMAQNSPAQREQAERNSYFPTGPEAYDIKIKDF